MNTYRMEWIALIDRHLKVGLELVKSRYLREKKGRRVE